MKEIVSPLLSHNGVLVTSQYLNQKNTVQLTDLSTYGKLELEVESRTLVAFYDGDACEFIRVLERSKC